MIDFHTHILPAIDDGAHSTEIARKIVEAETEQGVKTLVFTPHYYGQRRSPKQFIKERNDAFEKVKPHLNGLETKLGAEVYFSEHGYAAFEDIAKLAIGDTKYVLFELPFTERWSDKLFERISDFIHATSCTPIIAHVERYEQVHRHPHYLNELLRIGCLLQVNADFFQKKHTMSLSKAMLKHGMVHCIGTDTHNLSDRAPNWPKTKTTLEKAGYGAAFEKAQACMRDILDGKTIAVDTTQTVKKFLWKFY